MNLQKGAVMIAPEANR